MNPWWPLFVTPLFTYSFPWFGPVGFYTPYLVVPFAALLGRVYGVSGVVSIALGALLLVPTFSTQSWGSVGGNPALYLVALAVAALAASPKPLAQALRWPQDDRAAWWLALAAPFLLVLYLAAGMFQRAGGDVLVAFGMGFSALGYFLLFVLGARGVRAGPVVIGLMAAALLGWTLKLNGIAMPRDNSVIVAIAALQPAAAIAALAMLSGGAAAGARLQGRPVSGIWRRPYLAVALLVLLWFGIPQLTSIGVPLPNMRSIDLLGATYALPLAGFMAGLLSGKRGDVARAALALVLPLVCAPIGNSNVPLEAPLVAGAWALAGASTRDLAAARPDFSMLRVPMLVLMALLLVLGATLSIYGEGGALRTTLAALFLLTAVAALVLFWRARCAMAARGIVITSEKWAPFATILAVIGTVATNLQQFGESLKQLFVLVLLPASLVSQSAKAQLQSTFGSEIDGTVVMMLIGVAVVYLIVAVGVVRGLWRTLPKIVADLRKIRAFVRELPGHWRALVAPSRVKPQSGGG
jgi:hypothetical protein